MSIRDIQERFLQLALAHATFRFGMNDAVPRRLAGRGDHRHAGYDFPFTVYRLE